jgi:alcohol-forming fatty acyl-CoA reductase
VLIRSK